MAVLIVEKGPDRGRNILCSQFSPLIIGRGSNTTFKLSDPSISREHFKIYHRDGYFYIEDIKSLNGTMVNGCSIESPCLLVEGAQINIGETGFTWSEMEQGEKDPLIGRKLAGYHILKRLGRGGMGTVYLARQLSLQRDVAIKVLDSRLGKNNTFIQQFIEEARASATLNHPNILQVYDVGGKDGLYYFSMEYAEHGSIQRLIEGQKKLTAKVAIHYMLDTAKGLEYAQRKKIVHRDIKPDNLMLSEDDAVKIGDLGLAKRLDQAGNGNKQEQGIYGTPHFIAPEQAQGEVVDYRADMYSFGASSYRILSGRTPFQGQNSQQIILQHIFEKPQPLQSLEPSLPNELCKIIAKMMQKDKNKRYANNGEIIAELEKVQRIIERKDRKIKSVQNIAGKAKTLEKNVTCRIGAEKKIRQNAMRRHKKMANSYYVFAAMAIMALGVLLAMSLAPSSQKKRSRKNQIKSKVIDNSSGENNRMEHGAKEKDPLEERYNELKRSQFSAADSTPFIKDFQELVEKDPCGDVGNKALQELERLLYEKVILPCEKLQKRKKYYLALQKLAKFEKVFFLPVLQQKIVECQAKVEEAYSKELTYLEADFCKYERKKQYYRIDEHLKRLAKVKSVCSEEFEFVLDNIFDSWSAKIKTHIDPPEATSGNSENTQNLFEQDPPSQVDEKLQTEYRQILNKALASFHYRQGAKELEVALASWDQKYPRQWKKTPKELRLLNELFKKLGENITSKRYPVLDVALQKEFATKNVSLNPIRIDKDKLITQIVPSSGGSYTYKFSLKKLGSLWLYENLMIGYRDKGKYLPIIALYCYHYRLYRQSWKFCDKASKNKAKFNLVRDIKARLQQVENKARNFYKNDLGKEYRDLRQRQRELTEQIEQGQDIIGAKKEFLQNVKRFEKKLKQYREQYRYTRYFLKIEK